MVELDRHSGSGMIPIVAPSRTSHDGLMDTSTEQQEPAADQPAAGDQPPGFSDREPVTNQAEGSDQPADPRHLQRSTTDRMLGGVAGGVAEYLGVDPSIVRIAFVVLTLFGGIGVVLYGAGWLLMPENGNPLRLPQVFSGSRRHKTLLVVGAVIIGIITLNLLSEGPWWGSNSWHFGRGAGWILAVGVIGYLVLRGFQTPISLRRVRHALLMFIVLFLAFVVFVAACGLVAELSTGVPLRGGIGSESWRPISIAEVQPIYRTAIGNMTVDLSQVTFPDRPIHVTASVGIGHLLVEVPPGVTVSLTAHSGIGNVTYGYGGQSALLGSSGAGNQPTAGTPLLVLNAQAGIGQVELIRSTQGMDSNSASGPNPVLKQIPTPAPPAVP